MTVISFRSLVNSCSFFPLAFKPASAVTCRMVFYPLHPGKRQIDLRESHLAMEMLEEAKIITSAEFVEVNPILDERNKTAQIAVGLMGSLFGEKLL